MRPKNANKVPFVKSECGLVKIAGSLRNAQQFEIGLQQSVFTGGAVYDVKNTVENDAFTANSYREITSVDGIWHIIFTYYKPLFLEDMDPVRVIFAAVKIFINYISAVDGNSIFAGEAAHGYGNIFLHKLNMARLFALTKVATNK